MMAKVRLAPAFVGSLDLGRDPELGEGVPHRALMWLLARVSAHVHHQHVLGFEGFLLSRTVEPPAHKLLLLSMDVVIIYMLGLGKKKIEKSNGNIQLFSAGGITEGPKPPKLKS